MRKKLRRSIVLFVLSIVTVSIYSQENTDKFIQGKTYIIDSIKVEGLANFSPKTVISYTNLRKGEKIQLPSDRITEVIKKLWGLNLFSNINLYVTNVIGKKITLLIEIDELPSLEKVKVNGVKKGKAESLVKDTELTKGKKLSQSFLTNTKNYILNEMRSEGYLNTKVVLNPIPDSTNTNKINLVVNIDKGNKVKIEKIVFEGNSKIKSSVLRTSLKNTKQVNFFRVWKKSKFIPDDFEEDLNNLVEFYKEKGYRDARVLKDSVYSINDEKLEVVIDIEEGNKYYFGDINYIGNSAYNNFQLNSILRINKGDTYNGVLLKSRIQNDKKPDGEDITNLYQNNGYLFSNINAVEVSAINDTINFEIRINEGKKAFFDKVNITGNFKTNDNILYRELRTIPGEIYSKENVIRTIRELGQLAYIDAESIGSPDIDAPDPNSGTVNIGFDLTESGGSQIELQGGYGGGGFIGTLGLSFNNFSMKNIFDKRAYRPVPTGDGQTFSLRLQASQFFRTYSFSYIEPWLGGKQPVQFSVSLSRTNQFRYDFVTQRPDKSQSFDISSISLGLAKRLKRPDDYFTLSQSLSYQLFELNNYFTGLFTFGNGVSNNIAYTVALSRNNTYVNPIFPVGGSQFTISGKFSPPYSLFSKRDFSNLENNPDFQTIDATGNIIANISAIDQEKFRLLEYYKIKFSGTWYTKIWQKLILKTQTDFGFIGNYNSDIGDIPFERFYIGGDGIQNFGIDGRETIALRGYPNQSLSTQDGSTIYNKFSLELRYPITLKPSASIYGLTFLEAGQGYNNFKDFSPFSTRRSAGGGIRVFMPAFGLLGIDFGYGFDNVNPNLTEPNGWETHFIIGQQF